MRGRIDIPGTLALAGGVVCWGSMPVFLRELTRDVDAWTANAVRYPFAALLYWPILVAARAAGLLDRRLLLRALGPAAFAICGQTLWALAPYYIEASRIGFLVKAALVWAIVGSMVLFPEERVLLGSRRFHAGLLLAAAGFAALALARGALEEPLTLQGTVIMFFCSAFFGLYGVSVRYFLREVKAFIGFGVVSQYVSVATITFFLVGHAPAILLEIPGRAWVLLLVSSTLGIGISHFLFYTAIQRLGPTITNSGHLTGPFVTLALAHVFLGEALSAEEWIAGVVLIAGGVLLVLTQRRRESGTTEDTERNTESTERREEKRGEESRRVF